MSHRSEEDAEPLGRAGASASTPTVLPLSEEQCWTYLRAQLLGRLAIVVAGRPEIFPVNYAVGEKSIVFRTAPGTKLGHGPGSVGCFEIDGYDHHAREGWSVVAVGHLEEITEAADSRSLDLRQLRVDPIAPGARLRWIALHPEQVTGRQFASGWIIPGDFLG